MLYEWDCVNQCWLTSIQIIFTGVLQNSHESEIDEDINRQITLENYIFRITAKFLIGLWVPLLLCFIFWSFVFMGGFFFFLIYDFYHPSLSSIWMYNSNHPFGNGLGNLKRFEMKKKQKKPCLSFTKMSKDFLRKCRGVCLFYII